MNRGAAMQRSRLILGNVVVGGHRTSIRLERAMWQALEEIQRIEGKTLNQLVTEIDRHRPESSLTAAIRVFIVEFYREAAVRSGMLGPRPSLSRRA